MRQSGILMHITSLPGPHGVGTLGKSAYAFVDFLQQAGQSYWQILPLNPTGYGDSPYQSCSAFAGNHYLIDLDFLVSEGLLKQEEVDALSWCEQEDRVDFGLLYRNKLTILRKAFQRHGETADFAQFRAENDDWLPDYADFMCQKDRFDGQPWYQWPDEIKTRSAGAFAGVSQEQVQFHCFVQYLFFRQWDALKAYAHQKGVKIIGDVPIYVPYDSADVWCTPELFQLDEQKNPTDVAGVPPDAFSQDGQLWGNPLYRWDVMKQDGYRWWIRRLQSAARLYDRIRLDHFRGFAAYWSVPNAEETARNGRWISGPGTDFFRAVEQSLPDLPLIAEDLGILTQDVLDLRDELGYPGMKVLCFAFDSREPSAYLPHNHIKNAVCYIGTHDNMTCRQWLETASAETLSYCTSYMGLSREEGYVWGVIRTAMASRCDLCVIQMQDFLELGEEGRMNFPGTRTPDNWTWRLTGDYSGLAEKIYCLTERFDRLTR